MVKKEETIVFNVCESYFQNIVILPGEKSCPSMKDKFKSYDSEFLFKRKKWQIDFGDLR